MKTILRADFFLLKHRVNKHTLHCLQRMSGSHQPRQSDHGQPANTTLLHCSAKPQISEPPGTSQDVLEFQWWDTVSWGVSYILFYVLVHYQ